MLLMPTTMNPTRINASVDEETRYKDFVAFGGTPVQNIIEHIQYSRREIVMNTIFPGLPNYSGINCGVTGAGNKIAFYNIQFPELIPGHNPGFQLGANWFWSPTTPQIRAMMDELDVRMGGRGPGGVTFWEYVAGFANFTVSRGVTPTLDTVRAGNNAVLPSFFTAIANGVPVSLFLNGYNTTNGPSIHSTGHDIRVLTRHSGGHIMIAFGYQRVYYFDHNDNLFRQDLYLRVSSGFGTTTWTRINTHSILDHAITLHMTR